MKNSLFISLHNVGFSNSNKVLFSDLNLTISKNNRIGIVGNNGVGKSTLLNIIARNILPTSGSIESNAKIVLVSQLDRKNTKRQTVYEYLSEQTDEWWNVLNILDEELGSLKYQDLDKLSGGEYTRLRLALALSQNPDILLLDEPTNNLDQKTKDILLGILNKLEISIVIVSHDIDFLNQFANIIWYLNDGRVKVYGGNYSFFKDRLDEEEVAALNRYEAQVKVVKKLQQSFEKEKVRASRSLAVGKKKIGKKESIDKFAKAYFGNRSQKKAGKNKLRFEARISEEKDKIENIKLRPLRKSILKLKNIESESKKIFSISDGKLYLNQEVLFENINFDFNIGHKVLIKGDNGVGKTLFVKCIKNSLDSQEDGNVRITDLKIFNSVKVIYLDQKYSLINLEKTLFENVKEYANGVSYEDIRQVLGNQLFYSNDLVNLKAKHLSGGEIVRLTGAILQITKAEVLILDEPTNNLDIISKEILTESLNEFNGSVILISHDKNFISNIKLDKFYEIKDSKFLTQD